MIIFLLIITAFLVSLYITMKQYKSSIIAIGYVISNQDGITTKINYDKNDKKQLYALVLLHATKVKWLSLTEHDLSLKIFRNVLDKTINDWPQIPIVEMTPFSQSGFEIIYKINLLKSKLHYTTILELPKRGYASDMVTHYFVLLKAIANELNNEEKNRLGDLLKKYINECKTMSTQKRSYFALLSDERKINKLLKQVK